MPTDLELNQIGVLRRRAIEARVLAPVVAAMVEEFGAERGATRCDFRYHLTRPDEPSSTQSDS